MRRRPSRPLTSLLVATAVTAALAVAPTGVADAKPCGANVTGSLSGSSSLGSSLPFLGSILPSGNDPRGPQGPLPVYNNGTTKVISWVTGPKSPNSTYTRFGISGTDLGIAWDNGVGETLMAFGDTFGNCTKPGMQWRHNVLLRSTDTDLSNGLTVSGSGYAQQLIGAIGFSGIEITTIPTAGIAIDGKQYINYMSVRKWGAPSHWDTNFSATAVSADNGQTWVTQPQTIRVNAGLTVPLPDGWPSVEAGNENFQQAAYVRGHDDDYVYQFGTPNGRFGSAYVARVHPEDILDLSKFQYWTGDAWAPTPADARPVVKAPVTELSVAWSPAINKYVMLDSPLGVSLRTADRPEGPWSSPKTVLPATLSVYAPMMLPSSPALLGTGRDLYFNASRWDEYNVLMVRTRI